MYYDFYQFKENPFNVTADPDLFYSNKTHDEAIFNLRYGLEHRKGILVLTGEIGTGKTTLCRKILQQSDKKTHFALILNPNFSEIEMLQFIVQDFGIKIKTNNKYDLMQALNKYLIKKTNKGHNVILMIDEAQNLSVLQLEQIRLLSNLETKKEKLLQIILIGQPELYDNLQLPALRQLRQRIAVHYHLQHLQKIDIQYYIHHRMMKSRISSRKLLPITFSEKAVEKIYQYTKGAPRTINMLCDRALLAGFVKETHLIDEDIIESCAKEVLYCEHYL